MVKGLSKRETILEIQALIEWGNTERINNNIYRKSADELNEDWIDKLIVLKNLIECEGEIHAVDEDTGEPR